MLCCFVQANAGRFFAKLDHLYERDGDGRFARLQITGETRAGHVRAVIAEKNTGVVQTRVAAAVAPRDARRPGRARQQLTSTQWSAYGIR